MGRQPDRALHLPGRLLRRADPGAGIGRAAPALAPPLCGPAPPATALATTEPDAGSDAAAITTTATRVDGGYVLAGHKKFIGNAPIADACVVFATVAPGTRSRGDHGVRRRARRSRLRARGPAAEDGQPLLPGRRAALRGPALSGTTGVWGGGPGAPGRWAASIAASSSPELARDRPAVLEHALDVRASGRRSASDRRVPGGRRSGWSTPPRLDQARLWPPRGRSSPTRAGRSRPRPRWRSRGLGGGLVRGVAAVPSPEPATSGTRRSRSGCAT